MTTWEQPPQRSPSRSLRTVVVVVVAAIALGAAVLIPRDDDALEVVTGPSEAMTEPVVDVPVATSFPWPAATPGVWRRLPPAPITSRIGHGMVWTGDEVLIWGGLDRRGRLLADGAAFDPATGRWRQLPPVEARGGAATAAWTGDRAVFVTFDRTVVYDPGTDAWMVGPPPPTARGHRVRGPLATVDGTVVALTRTWTDDAPTAHALSLDGPTAWDRLADLPADVGTPVAAVGRDRSLLVFGPTADGRPPRGFALDLDTADGPWRPVPAPRALAGITLRTAVGAVRGDTLLLWGSGAGGGQRGFGATTDDDGAWQPIGAGPLAGARSVDGWTVGRQFVVWDRIANRGAVADPVSGRWVPVPPPPLPEFRPRVSVSTGGELLVWGGLESGGAAYLPLTDPLLP